MSGDTKHTPGPWIWREQYLGHFTVSKDEDEIVLWPQNAINADEAEGSLNPNNHREWWSSVLGACGKNAESCAPWNAALLASAPDLLAVLEECARYFVNRPGNWETQLHERIAAALRKAKP